jgi:hypothetical protein
LGALGGGNETVLKEGRSSRPFYEVGAALKEIRDHKLYWEDYAMFEKYCRERWGLSRIHAHRLIEAAGVFQNVLPIGNKPMHESQIRPLVGLDPDQQLEAWKLATATSANPTAAEVEDAAKHAAYLARQQAVFDIVATTPPQKQSEGIRNYPP